MRSLQFNAVAASLITAAVALGTYALALHWRATHIVALLMAAICATPFALWFAHRMMRPIHRLNDALDTLMQCWRDGDYASHLSSQAEAMELHQLALAHQKLGQAIRDERHELAQREWLLDTVVQHTPVALLLLNGQDRIVLANLAARGLLAEGRSLKYVALRDLLATAPAALAQALATNTEGLVRIEDGADPGQWLVSQRQLQLHGQPLRLVLLRPLARELARQEVAAWKRVLRVLSHELNNSLAPMSSMAHSGAELSRRADQTELAGIFDHIGSRAKRLHEFLAGYAQFAKLPAPQCAAINWQAFVEQLRSSYAFELAAPLPTESGWADATQLEQAVLNLLKNAHESGSAPNAIELSLRLAGGLRGVHWQLSIADRGPGVSDAVLAQALLPFYSTKRGGTGLGLALAREIAEAHSGHLELRRRAQGGLRATLSWPNVGMTA